MNDLKLVIGNKNYSSWSLRAWLLLRRFDLPFDEVRIPLSQDDTASRLKAWSPSRKVPVLVHGELTIWDTLAICEYVSEQFLDGGGWPRDRARRARARSVSAEMHSGFTELRARWPMNCRLQHRLEPDAGVARDVARIEEIWSECLSRDGGGWLFGDFSIADCMFAPVALRFHSYRPELGEPASGYVRRVLADEHVQSWMDAGRAETEIIEEDELQL